MSEAKQVDFLLVGLVSPETREPLAGGAVYVYEAGTSTPSNLWLDRAKTDLATNPIILDASGKALVFGDGVYRFVVREIDNVTEPIIIEYDGLEYTPNLVSSAQAALTENLDFAGLKGINAGPGTDPTDTINKGQLDTVESELKSKINTVQNNLDTTEFLDLTDTPSVYTAANKKLVRVKDDLSGVEFVSINDAMVNGLFTDLFDTPASYATHTGKAAIVNSTSDGLTFGYPDSKTLQGKAISTNAPADKATWEYDLAAQTWKPVPPGATTQLQREVVWTGNATTAGFTKADIKFLTIVHTNGGPVIHTVEAETAGETGNIRILNRGGENADRVYDYVINVSRSGDTWTITSTVLLTKISVMF